MGKDLLPADAILRLFKGGFDFEDNMVETIWNLSGEGIPFSQTGAPTVENKGDFNDANQGEVHMVCNPMGSRVYTTWEQELPIVDEDGQKHFQGLEVWFI